ncbi:hypothetical protein HZA56_03160 [Candidatus Poribacteria bacterium]|nr:hypothetical protein [Candidatus Poribacteria bacterium]
MLGSGEQEKIRNVIKVDWSIYLAFCSAIVMYTFVVFLVVGKSSSEPGEAGALKNLFIAISIGAGVAKFWVQNRLLYEEAAYMKCQSLDEIITKYRGYNFIILGVSEVPALLGLIITFMTRRLEEWWLFFGISAVLYATSAPRQSKLESIAEAHLIRSPGVSGSK